MQELSAFQRDVLFIIAGSETPHGLAIKNELEQYYSAAVNHGRLYPNLDELVDAGLLTKGEVDGRTNKYDLTPKAEQYLQRRLHWELDRADVDLDDAAASD